MIKKTVSLLLAAALVFTVCFGCSRKKDVEEPTTQPTQPVTVADPGVPFFMLSGLPGIGAYNSGNVYSRWYEGYTDTFKPSDKYGSIIAFIGETKQFTESGYSEGGTVRQSLYGLATADGKVVVDPVYSEAYTTSDSNGKTFLVVNKSENIKISGDYDYDDVVTVLPTDGKWAITLQNYIFCGADNNRIVLCNEILNLIRVYNYSGELLFSLSGNQAAKYSFNVMVYYAGALNEPEQETQPLATAPYTTVPSTASPTVPTTKKPAPTTAAPKPPETVQPVTEPTTAAPETTTEHTTQAPTTRAPEPTTPSPTVAPKYKTNTAASAARQAVTPMALTGSSSTPQVASGFTLVDANGKILVTNLVSADMIFENGYMQAETRSGHGILSTAGIWVVPPTFKEVNNIEGLYFVLSDGITAKVVDSSLRDVKTFTYGENSRYLDVAGDKLVYSQNGKYYLLSDDSPITNTQSGLQATEYIYGSDLFFAIDPNKTGYLFTVDGRTVNSFENALQFEYYNGGYYSISCGAQRNSTSFVYSSSTNKQLLSFTSAKGNASAYSYPAEYGESIIIIYRYADINSSEPGVIDIFNTSTGKYLFKDCLDANIQYINGRAFISVSFEKYTAVYTEQLKLILKMTNQYND